MNATLRVTFICTSMLSLLAGCVSGTRAVPSASLRSGCAADAIDVVSQDGHDLVLDVCGTHESWRWHALNGWEYVGMAGAQPVRGPIDVDADGVPDDVDACPAVAGQSSVDRFTNGCPPPPDQDGDGVADAQDACPSIMGAPQSDAAQNGCPADADADGIADAMDACPDRAGVASDDASTNGCPADRDGDGVVDALDACPAEAGAVRLDDATRHGCPEPVPDEVPDAETDGDAAEDPTTSAPG